MSLKEELLAAFRTAAAAPPKPVDIDGFPTFYVRAATIGEVDERNASQDDWAQAHKLTVGSAAVICDADGTLLFDPTNREEMDLIFKQSWPTMQKILAAISDGETTQGNSASAKS